MADGKSCPGRTGRNQGCSAIGKRKSNDNLERKIISV
jgi:hypothetical protein